MKKWKAFIVVLTLILIMNIGTIVSYAYIIGDAGCNYKIDTDSLPAYNTYTYYKTTLAPSACNNAITGAINTWNAEDSSMQFVLSGEVKTGFDTTDAICTIGSMVDSYEFEVLAGTYTAVACNSTEAIAGEIVGSDIYFNDYFTFGNGQGVYHDYQGILTHELGHTWGLKDIYENDIQFSASNVNELPTMFGSVEYSGFGSSVSVFLRGLSDGDIDGLQQVKEIRNFGR